MDQEPQNTTSGCPVCGGSRWWHSRTGHEICQRCHPDALEALQALANQVKTATPYGSMMGDAVIEMRSDQSTAEDGCHALQGSLSPESCWKEGRRAWE
jgi:hypothetical protein